MYKCNVTAFHDKAQYPNYNKPINNYSKYVMDCFVLFCGNSDFTFFMHLFVRQSLLFFKTQTINNINNK